MSIIQTVHSLYEDILEHLECPLGIREPQPKSEPPSGVDQEGLVEQVSIQCTCVRCLMLIKLISIKCEVVDICQTIVGEENVQ